MKVSPASSVSGGELIQLQCYCFEQQGNCNARLTRRRFGTADAGEPASSSPSQPSCRPPSACRSASRCARTLKASSASAAAAEPCCRRGLPGSEASASASASCVLLPEPVRRSSWDLEGSSCGALSPKGLAVSSSGRSGLAVAGVHSPGNTLVH